MAEHDERNFEHEFSEKLKMLDKNIKIPEIPDAHGIFEKAEKKKTNAVPFKRYSKYVAAAAAVVLICIGVPVMASVIGSDQAFSLANEEASIDDGYYIFDSTGGNCALQEAPNAESAEEPQESDDITTESEPENAQNEEKAAAGNEAANKDKLTYAINDFFRTFTAASSSSSSAIDTDSIKTIEDYINKKRSIEITIDEGSVSVVLFDNSAEGEIINAFWVEGIYQSSGIEDGHEYYVINLIKTIAPEEIENGNYLPMVGDANGTYTIDPESVLISENITKGVISLVIEINVGTGEYRIYASLV